MMGTGLAPIAVFARNRCIHTLAMLAVAATLSTVGPHAAVDSPYLTPPKAIVDILEAAPTPTVMVSPTRDRIALLERQSMPSIADVSRPMLRLAGLRIDPGTNGLHQPGGTIAITFTVKNAAPRKAGATAAR